MKKICFVFLLLLTLIPLGVSAQQQMIQGRVLDDKGESIIGASVSVRGTVTGGITNLDGEFSVAGKVGDMLTISYGEFYQFNLSSCIRQQNSLTAQFVSFSLANLANIFYPPQFLQ